jgi:DNA polymerase II small subunit/DNA polymerase delta subunit B
MALIDLQNQTICLKIGMSIEEIVKEYPNLTEKANRETLEELAHSDLLAPSENASGREHA